MATYIDADKYLNYLHSREADFLDDYGKGWVAGICTAQRSAKHFFVNIDEQKKAHWQWFDEETGNPIDGYERDWGWECSNCFYILPDDFDDLDIEPTFRYCMNCGAQMFSEDLV